MAASRNLEVVKGDDYLHEVTIEDNSGTGWNLTGYTGAAQLREDAADAGAPTATFTVTITDAANGVLTMELANTDTDALVVGRTYYYDLELTDGSSKKTTILKGELKVTQDVTR